MKNDDDDDDDDHIDKQQRRHQHSIKTLTNSNLQQCAFKGARLSFRRIY